jgi:hypothetical protein
MTNFPFHPSNFANTNSPCPTDIPLFEKKRGKMQNTAMQKHQEEICRTPLLEEEKLLTKNLAGYKDYQKQVIYRLLPFIW